LHVGFALFLSSWLCAAVAADSEGAQRFRPKDPGYVVLAIAPQRANEESPLSAQDAQRVAANYLDLARSAREPRYFGRAEAVLRPWIARSNTTPGLLLLQADILQNRHDFKGARHTLDRVVSLDPSEPRAHLMRATLLMVQGESARARSDCAALMGLGETAIGTVCLAQSLAGTGQIDRAESMIGLVLNRDELREPATLAWAQATLGELATRRGDLAAAKFHLRTAFEATPQDESIRSALADVLIASQEPDEALQVLDLPRPSVGLLVRRLLAQTIVRDAGRGATLGQLKELLRLEAERGERVHLREETLLALGTGRPPKETLALAQANFAVQREAIDARLLARAAFIARDANALDELSQWRSSSGFKDRLLDSILRRRSGEEPAPSPIRGRGPVKQASLNGSRPRIGLGAGFSPG